MKYVMIDFETLGNGKDKCICQVVDFMEKLLK